MEQRFAHGLFNLNRESQKLSEEIFIQKLIIDGGKPFIVGGFVRDTLLNKNPKDIDIIVEGMDITTIQKSIAALGIVNIVGESFAVIKFKPFGSTVEYDIAAPRTEIKTGAGHKGFTVQSDSKVTVADDLGRRDLTINSMSFDIQTLKLFDPFNGIKDLTAGLIKMTNPVAFIDDPLRILRTVQFAVRFDFEIEKETLRLMCKHIDLVKEIAGERIHEELVKAFEKGSSTRKTFELLKLIGFHRIFEIEVDDRTIDDSKIKILGDFFFAILGGQQNSSDLYMKLFKGETRINKQILAIFKQVELGKDNVHPAMIAAEMLKITKDAYQLGCVCDVVSKFFKLMQLGLLPASITDMQINGDDIKNLGLEGKAIGDILKLLFREILTDNFPNDRDLLLVRAKAIIQLFFDGYVTLSEEINLIKSQLELIEKDIRNMVGLQHELSVKLSEKLCERELIKDFSE